MLNSIKKQSKTPLQARLKNLKTFKNESGNTMKKLNVAYTDHYFSNKNNKLVKFEFYGKELIEKDVRSSGSSGRVYLPPSWIGCKVKIVKIDE